MSDIPYRISIKLKYPPPPNHRNPMEGRFIREGVLFVSGYLYLDRGGGGGGGGGGVGGGGGGGERGGSRGKVGIITE